MKNFIMIIGTALIAAVFFGQSALASTVYPAGAEGVDVSHPNCGVAIPRVNFGVVGVNGGLVFSDNPCVAAQAKNFTNLSLYMNTGLNANPSSTYYAQAQQGCNGDANCAAYNYGYNAGTYAINYAKSKGVESTKWWLDVETMNTWNADVMQNRQSIQGAYDAAVASGATTVGVYSTTSQWKTITGGWLNNWPSWGATTWTTARQAKTYCTGHEFTGGPSLLMQFMSKKSKLDQNVAC